MTLGINEPVLSMEEKELKEYNEIIDVLGADANNAEQEWRRDPSNQFRRRSFIRAGFAYIEGHLYQLKQLALALDNFKLDLRAGDTKKNAWIEGTMLTPGERMVLAEETFEVDDKGKVYPQTRFVRLDKNIKLAFRAFAKAYSIDFPIDFGVAEWGDFKTAIDIRNRITHPKGVADLKVSDAEMQVVDRGLGWYCSLADRCIAKLGQITAERTLLMKRVQSKEKNNTVCNDGRKQSTHSAAAKGRES